MHRLLPIEAPPRGPRMGVVVFGEPMPVEQGDRKDAAALTRLLEQGVQSLLAETAEA